MTGPAFGERATSVVVVNYRTKELTHRAATSVLAEPEVREVVVVDNASGDGSAEFLRGALSGAPAHLVEAPANVGFGAAANLGAARASSPLLFLLNSDATVEPGALARLADRLLESSSNAVVAPAIRDAAAGTPQPRSFGRFPAWWQVRWGGSRSRRRHRGDGLAPDWVSGVAMLLRRHDFLSVGGFDPDFHMYLEDVDLCRRFRERGMAVRREPAAVVLHLGGASWTSSLDQRARYQASKLVYFRKAGVTPAQLAYLRALSAARVLAARWSREPSADPPARLSAPAHRHGERDGPADP